MPGEVFTPDTTGGAYVPPPIPYVDYTPPPVPLALPQSLTGPFPNPNQFPAGPYASSQPVTTPPAMGGLSPSTINTANAAEQGQADPGRLQAFIAWVRSNPAQAASVGLTGLTALLGIGGVIQALSAGDPQTTQVVQRALTTASPTETAAFQAAISGINQIGQFAFGPSAPPPLPGMPTNLPQASPTNQGLGGMLGGLMPYEAGAIGTGLQHNMAGLNNFYQTAFPLAQQFGQQGVAESYNQNNLLNTLAAVPDRIDWTMSPDIQEAFMGDVLGFANGIIPGLYDPAANQALDEIFNARAGDIDRFVENSLQNVMDTAHSRGFQGGMEIFREGAPAALLAPTLSEATRQFGNLAGERAQAGINLGTQLPLLGSQIDTARMGNIFGATNNLANITQAYNTPLALRTQGLPTLAGIQQGYTRNLLDFGQQGIGNNLDFIRATTAPASVAGNIGVGSEGNRVAGASTTSTTTTPGAGMLGAFGPTASLLGGVGGFATGIGLMNNPAGGIR